MCSAREFCLFRKVSLTWTGGRHGIGDVCWTNREWDEARRRARAKGIDCRLINDWSLSYMVVMFGNDISRRRGPSGQETKQSRWKAYSG